MDIAVDFDGAITRRDLWPEIGEINEEMVEELKSLRAEGHQLILLTCRGGRSLNAALDACESRGLVFDAVNRNLDSRVKKFGYDSDKVGADVYVDDRAVGPEAFLRLMKLCRGRKAVAQGEESGVFPVENGSSALGLAAGLPAVSCDFVEEGEK